jgi:hypothetical protein
MVSKKEKWHLLISGYQKDEITHSDEVTLGWKLLLFQVNWK